MSTDRLAVAAVGEPRDPATWSGTPANIVAALERLGVEVVGIDAAAGRVRDLVYFGRYQARRAGWAEGSPLRRVTDPVRLARSGLRSDFHWDRPVRRHRAAAVVATATAAGCRRVLHMSDLTLPTPGDGGGIDHLLLADSTWHTLRRDMEPPWRHSAAMVEEGDRLQRETLTQVRHAFPIAEYVADDMVATYGVDRSRITVVGTGRGKIEPFDGPKPAGEPFMLFVAKARFDEKGGQLLLDAFARARRANPKLRLVMVGDEARARVAPGTPGLTVYGHISWDKLQRLFHRASLFAMPARREPWGLVYLEAMAARTPVLGLHRNAVPEMTAGGAHGFLIRDPDAGAVAEAILDAFSDPERLLRMGEEAQRFCLGRYSWDLVARRIATAIDERLAGAHA